MNRGIQVLSVKIVHLDIGGQLGLPFVAVHQEFLLVVQQLFVSFGGVLKVGAFDDGVN